MNTTIDIETRKFLIVDDHEMCLVGLKTIIETQSFWKVGKYVKTAQEAIFESEQNFYDLIIIDYYLLDQNGFETAKMILEKNSDRRILIISSIQEPSLKPVFLDAGIQGYLFKSESPEKVLLAINQILQGGVYFSEFENSETNLNQSLGPFKNLSPRELEIVIYTAKGYSQKEISQKLKIALKTVEIHKRNLKRKIGKMSDIEMAKQAITFGLIKDNFLISLYGTKTN